jgi:nucleoside-diphosphate-sugar epimerase
MKKILLTGATGFIGSHTLNILFQNGYEVHAVTSKVNTSLNPNVIWHQVNLFDNNKVKDLLKNIMPSYLMHLAWYAEPGKYINGKENLKWLQSSIEMLQSFINFGGKKVVFAGTCFEYDLKYGYLQEAITPSIPNCLYGACKLSFESIAQMYCGMNNISFASGRIFYLFGEGENKNRIIPYVINSLLNDSIANCSHGNQIRDFLSVRDVALALVAILESETKGIVNIGSGNPIKLGDLLLTIGEKLQRVELINLGAVKTPMNEPSMIVAENKKLIEETSWKQTYSIEEELDITIEWWKEQRKSKYV